MGETIMKKGFLFTISCIFALTIAFFLLSSLTEEPESLFSLSARDYAVFSQSKIADNNHMFCFSYYTYTQSILTLNPNSDPVLQTSCGVWNE